ncbi:MAG: hypothetical protein PF447_01250, partial [Spirochaetaceae bacterium]|nr:hypothetical protein [Spirochaetaceae bacterium]
MKIKLLLFFCLIATPWLFSQDIDMDKISAEEEFRLAVVAFHQGYFNKAIYSFERSLVFKPETSLVRQWLGRAYYQSGYEDAALNEWDNLLNAGLADSALLAFRDTVERRRGLQQELRQRDSWVELLNLDKDKDGESLFGRPSSVASSVAGNGHFYA